MTDQRKTTKADAIMREAKSATGNSTLVPKVQFRRPASSTQREKDLEYARERDGRRIDFGGGAERIMPVFSHD